MNLDSLSFALSQISYLVANLTKKNYKSNVTEIANLVDQYGPEADRHLLRCLFSHVDFSGDGRSSGKDFHQTQYLIQESSALITKPNFVSALCYAIDNPLHQQKSLRPSAHLFSQLSKVLKLTSVQEVAFSLAALSSSNTDTQKYALQFVRLKLPQLLSSYTDTDSVGGEGGGLRDTPIEVVHLLVSHLLSASPSDSLGVSADQKEAFFRTLTNDFPRDRVPVILAPLLYPQTLDTPLNKLTPDSVTLSATMSESLADMILELGQAFTKSPEQCRGVLNDFGAKILTASSVARVLGMMIRHPTGLLDVNALQSLLASGLSGTAAGTVGPSTAGWPDVKDELNSAGTTPQLSAASWNVEVFVDVVRELAPNIAWYEVVKELDYPGFQITSRHGFELLIQALFRGLTDVFPIELLYTLWKNKEGQLSWLAFSLKYSDVFCIDDFPHHTVSVDALKSLPDDENRDIIVWKSLDLIDILLQLADEGFHGPVLELFKFPVQCCPDLLLLGLLQTPRMTNLKKDLLSTIVPLFLGNHPNSVPVLQAAWHCPVQSNSVRTLVLHSMADWYMRGEPHDQARLSRILDVAQDLKALSMLLNATPFAFVIDLACLASRREYLKLDKWVSDKIREHGESFVQACVSFLIVRCPQLIGAFRDEQQTPQTKSQQLPPETISTMLSCLQAACVSLSPELHEDILRLVASGTMLLKPTKQLLPSSMVVGGLGPRAGLPPTQIPGLAASLGNQIDPLSGMPPGVLNAVAMAAAANNPSGAYPGSLAASLSVAAPGSPAKTFSQLGQLPQQAAAASQGPQNFSSIQAAFNSQLHSLNLQTGVLGGASGLGPGIGTGLGTGFGGSATGSSRGAPSLGLLSAQAALAQQPTAMRPTMNQSNELGSMFTAGAAPSVQSVSAATSSLVPPSQQQFSKEIEDEANSYFQRIYNTSGSSQHSAITSEQIPEMLKTFKDPATDKDKEVFQCMLRNLFEEYRFFHQYPDKELHTTAILFGSIIEQGLVTYVALGIALRYVLEALKKTQGTKMYTFGLTALDRFKTRLKDYPQYCQFLLSITHFPDFPPHLKEYIEYGAKSQDPPSGSVLITPTSVITSLPMVTAGGLPPAQVAVTATVTMATASSAAATSQTTHGAISRPVTSSSVSSRPSVANATNIDTLLANKEGLECVKVPPETLQDKVFFIFNNLSLSNMDQKAVELLECTGEEYLPWVAQYLVMKRASIEHNFHTLYSNFIDHLKKPEVLSAVIAETYRNIRVLLRCDKGVANYSDRTLLKNLGHWLGLLTLARNKPIFFREMDVKGLIYESYHKGAQELLYVIPFVAKILESCAKSRVFKPPNPWTMAMMNVLAELHREPDMKLNLKFEIEVLCKNLQIDINDLIPSQYLKDTSLLERLEPQLSAPSRPAKDGSTPQPDEPLQICMPIPSVAMGAGVMMSSSVGAMMAPPPAPPPTATVLPPVAQHPQPQFAYHDISGLTLTALMSHAVINEQIALFHAHPQLKTCVKPAIERAIQEMLPPAIERATKIAVTTSEMIVKKDFALDPDESRMRVGAHHLVRFMTAGMALITCHEPVLISINGQLKTAFITALGGASATQKELIEHAAQVLAQDNAELATAFLQKAAVEKAIPEIDKHLNNDYELRKHARSEGRRYCDPQVLTYQAERMPEQIRLKVGGVTPQQIAVYEEFSRCIPGFQPVGGSNMNTSGPELVTSTAMDIGVNNPNHPPTAPYVVKPLQSMIGGPEDIFQIYDKVYRDIEQHLSAFQAAAPNLPQTVAIRSLLEFVLHARQSVRDPNPAMALVQRAVEGLLDGFTVPPTGPEQEMMLRYRDCHLLVLRALQDQRVYGSQWTNKHVTRCLISCHEDYRYNIEAVDLLIHGQFVVMPQYDLHLTHSMESGMNYQAVVFAMTLVQRFCTDIDKLTVRAQEGDFCNTIEALSRIAIQSRQPPEGLATLLESLRQNTEGSLTDRVGIAPPPMMLSGIIQARELDDPPGLHEKTEYLLREWVGLYHMPAAGIDSGKAFQAFVAQMHMHGILKTDDLITRFFRLCTEMCVDLCYRVLSEPSQAMARVRVQCFHTLDAFVRLIQLLLRHSGDTSNTNTKINLLNKVLGIVAGVLLQDHDVRHTEFQQLPYHRIFIMLFIELNAPEQVLESINFDVLQAFCNVLHILRPVKAPGFAYAWLELVSHRLFIGRVLALTPNQRAWGMYATLLIDLFKFLAPFLRNAELTKPAQLLYKGTMRVLLVLLHDFPEFLCDYHYAFCDVIPPNCIQVRNLVLSAFPRNMRLPDPFTPNLKVDMLPDIALAPRIMSNFVNFIQPQSFRKEIDTYLKTRAPVTFVSELRSKLQVSSSPGMKYNIALMNALVMYVGTQAIQYIHSKSLTPSMATIAHSSHMDIFQNLAVDMDTEGRYLFLNAVANQLRYPNSHTHYFSCTLLYLFAEANSEAIQEQITRVLLERLIVNRPHPWGLLITFIELIKNPQFKFWNHEFVHCAPEIEKLLDSVARSCMQSKPREPDVTDVR